MTEPMPAQAAAPAGVSPSVADSFDLAIVGAGPVGLALTNALVGAGVALRIALIDRRAAGAGRDDPRALALAEGSRRILAALGAWEAASATPIRDIHVSQRGGFGRTLIEGSDVAAEGQAALGHVLRYGALLAALEQALVQAQSLTGAARVTRFAETTVAALAEERDQITLTLATGGEPKRIAARLVVHAEGSAADATAWLTRDYRQSAIVAEVTPARAHQGRAWERFTADGPLALLPLGSDYSLVYTTSNGRLPELLELDDAAFLALLRADFGTRLDFAAIGPRSAWPLALRARKTLSVPRQVWIGASAQTLHPVTGQGFNLGLRDALTLATVIGNAVRSVTQQRIDVGAGALLADYRRQRRGDRLGTIAFTDGLIRVFGSTLPGMSALRGIGLLALDVLPALRAPLARRLAHGTVAAPTWRGD
ncbi:FAD-dependent monooxygenase [Rhodocyclus purpureus]|uniref:FAD-dependent monooxygenase n=1 Tax=Rhodocyclus purpureus TaxID=1067 RepID=UPI0030844EE0